MSLLRYLHLDVFAATRGGGNHLGVVLGADAWDTGAMQRFAHWTDLVETTFVLPATQPRASYRVRIFTPRREIPFAGHPSVGSAHAALVCKLAVPIDGLLWQECAAGVLPLQVIGEGARRRLLLRCPPARVVQMGANAHPLLATALGGIASGKLPPALIAGGRRWWLAEADSAAALRAWQPDHAAIAALARATDSTGLCMFARDAQAVTDLVVRAFADGVGITEDAASGAANGLVAAYIAHAEPEGPLARGYVVSQGREICHDAAITVRMDARGIWVGGRVNTIIDGHLDWDATPDLAVDAADTALNPPLKVAQA